MFPKTAIAVLSLLLVLGCSTTPSLGRPPAPPIPPNLLLPCPSLPYQARMGTLQELGSLVIVTSSSYYECKSAHDDLIAVVKAREKLLTQKK